jgi:hypothetical protein
MFKKVVEYKILNVVVKMGKEVMLQKEVNQHIADGWTPKGALVIDQDGHLYQTMVKYETTS